MVVVNVPAEEEEELLEALMTDRVDHVRGFLPVENVGGLGAVGNDLSLQALPS